MLYLLSTSCVLTLAYSTLFPLILFGGTLLLLSSCRREGVHPELPGVRGLLGIRLPVDVPMAPCSASYESYRLCTTLSHTLYQTFVIIVINNIRIRFIISFYVLCAVIYYSLCCIYMWLEFRRVLFRSSIQEKVEKRQEWVHNLYSTSITQTMRL